MVDPINYGAMLSQLDLSPLRQGFQMRSNNRVQEGVAQQRQAVTQLAREKFEVDQQKETDYLSAVEAYKASPTPEGLRDLGLRFPEQAERLQKAADSYTTSQKNDLIGAGFSAMGALSAGKADLAVKTLEDRITALRNSGIDTSHTQAAVDMIKAGNVTGATSYLSYAMSGLAGVDHTATLMDTLGIGGKADDRRADNVRADRNADIAERRVVNTERATSAAIAGRERDDARADRKVSGRGGSAGNLGDGGYEWRVNPATGKLQRRKR